MSDDIDDFLMHHGIKGMHWGSHKSGTERNPGRGSGSGSKPARPTRAERSLSRANTKLEKVKAKTDEAAARDKAIVEARKNLDSTGQRLKLAKAEYKVNKHTMDKKAAKAELGKHKAAHAANVHDANLMTSSEQKAARDAAIRQALLGY